MKNIFKIILLFTVILTGMFTANAFSGLNVVLGNQNPDPVSPGNFVYVNLIISNIAQTDIKDVEVRFKENNNFKLAEGSQERISVGLLPRFSSQEGSSSFFVARYKVLVGTNTPLGLNKFDVDVLAEGRTFSYSFDIFVEDSNPSIQVKDFQIESIEAGKTQIANLILSNENSADIRDVEVRLNLDQVENKIFSTPSGSNIFRVPLISSGQTRELSFELSANPLAEANYYLLPMTLSFKDSLGNFYTQEVLGSVMVNSDSKIDLVVDNQNIFTSGNIRTVFAIANPGTSILRGVQLRLLPGENYEVLEGQSQYIGNLNPDDFQTIQSQIFVKEQKPTFVNVELIYSDSFNNRNQEVIQLPLVIYSNEQLQEFGLIQSSSGFGVGTIINLLVVLAIGFFIGRRIGFKKARKLNK